MERAKWNDLEISATDIASDYQKDAEIRKVSGKELICPDPECESPLLKYCHGEKKSAYFAHLHDGNCDYAQFDRQPSILREIRYQLYESFKKKGYDVEIEKKILKHHYTHLILKDGEKRIAVELGDKTVSYSKIMEFENQYTGLGISCKWIVVDVINPNIRENSVYFLKRYELNRSTENELFVIDVNTRKIAQYKMDMRSYSPQYIVALSKKYGQIFFMQGEIEDVCLENKHLSLPGFSLKYSAWLEQKSQFVEEEEKRKLIPVHKSSSGAEKGFAYGNMQQRPVSTMISRSNGITRQSTVFEDGLTTDERARQYNAKRLKEIEELIEKFRNFSQYRQGIILYYAKKATEWQDFSSLNEMTVEEQFTKILIMLPQEKLNTIKNQMK